MELRKGTLMEQLIQLLITKRYCYSFFLAFFCPVFFWSLVSSANRPLEGSLAGSTSLRSSAIKLICLSRFASAGVAKCRSFCFLSITIFFQSSHESMCHSCDCTYLNRQAHYWDLRRRDYWFLY